MFKTKTKKVMLALALVAVLALGGTFAYLTKVTNKAENVFTFNADGVSVELREPGWKTNEANNVGPGKELTKDPQITNLGELDVYAAIRVQFVNKAKNAQITPEEYTRLMTLMTVQSGATGAYSTDWTRIGANPLSANEIYYTNTSFAKNITTQPLFTNVTFKKNMSNADQDWLQTSFPQGFTIRLTPAAVQANAYASAQLASVELEKLLK